MASTSSTLPRYRRGPSHRLSRSPARSFGGILQATAWDGIRLPLGAQRTPRGVAGGGGEGRGEGRRCAPLTGEPPEREGDPHDPRLARGGEVVAGEVADAPEAVAHRVGVDEERA